MVRVILWLGGVELKITRGAAILGLCGLIATGCAANNEAGTDHENTGKNANIYQENESRLHVNSHEPALYDADMKADNKRFGYVRHKRSGVMGAENQQEYTINREQLANMISRLCVQVPKVDDVSTLVTDGEVLIVYETDADDKKATADQVKKTAMSAVPGWYNIHVSDDPTFRQTIENFATLNTNRRDINQIIDNVIEQMQSSPQGSDRTEGHEATDNNSNIRPQ